LIVTRSREKGQLGKLPADYPRAIAGVPKTFVYILSRGNRNQKRRKASLVLRGLHLLFATVDFNDLVSGMREKIAQDLSIILLVP
jgi:hypothetical protein